ncbi:glycosyltransferase family 4 protein [Arenimonas terrae]|uniref:Lipopolysaccharide biosynthesis protein n=1 Tax=Arenimonas terrae TaxID=2546226 RepID=A0A5C4RTV1_9GAMM|nr:lipopolysaccharide biosynthesis protein [Arenimonas terrae]TNJ34626.1 lipopolysaccharide biosynthesis protein [Arenimonas terrae]
MTLAVVPSPWLPAVLAAGVSFVAADAWRRFALHRQLLDAPGPRRLHQQPTPRGGGIAIALVLLAAAAWLGQGVAAFFVGLVVTAGAGLVDDLRNLSALPKLLLQGLGALPLAWAWPLAPELLGTGGGFAAALLLVLVLVNFWNFMDGSNGLAASQALLVGVGLAGLTGLASPAGWLGLMLAAACLGFLPHNLPKARLFLGDVGSHALGFAVAGLSLHALSRSDAGFWPLLLLPSTMLLDAGLTLLGRLLRRQKVWQAHREHLYQRAVAHGWSHSRICAVYFAWSGLALLLACCLAPASEATQAVATLAWLVAGAALYFWAGRFWPRRENLMESVG